ncbi:histidine kinase [Dissulfuribacter thermophilus]|uniref:histidine kinase n=1 Tax=Dissulfuribacter thermophilus TaxID=1156395 RepID=A0A1B9F4M9_9BACT|nr:HAMP domain-containing sensor histidine kinase [Dissulfuribacter thermophilus]OCC14890.1 histidine kinase [Dissulfuribacter thermophilus]
MSIYCPTDPPSLATVLARIRKKKEDYARYNFTQTQGRALRAFFDLAQEFETLENFYRVSVFVPKEFLGVDTCLYLVSPDSGMLEVICDSMNGLEICGMPVPKGIEIRDHSYEINDSFVAPIKGNRRLFVQHPIQKAKDVIGMFEVFPLSRLDEKDKLFFEKYANRIGYNLHYKLIVKQNVEHIKFVNTLVADIEHNVLVPNMRYKVFLNSFNKKLKEAKDIHAILKGKIDEHRQKGCPHVKELESAEKRMLALYNDLLAQYQELEKHYQNTSLFLESLLRRDHFEKGHLVLRRRMCRFKKEVIDPQLERYRARLERRGIRIDDLMGGIPEEEDIPLMVDVGLISQVYANLFSNAEKYCKEVLNEQGQPVKFIAYGREIINDFFGPGKSGIKFNVFTTGPHIPPEYASHIFDEGFRTPDAQKETRGVGHGLHFVKKVIEVHGGVVGYEPVKLGNNFYFILPLHMAIKEMGGCQLDGY